MINSDATQPAAPALARRTVSTPMSAAPSEARTTGNESVRSHHAIPKAAAPVSSSHHAGTRVLRWSVPSVRIKASASRNASVR